MTKLAALAFVLFLIFGNAVGKHSGSDAASDRIVFVERMNQDDPSQSFMAVGKGNRIFQIVSDTSSCTNILNYVSSDHVFIDVLYDKGFESVSCVGEHDGKVDVEQRQIVPVQPKPSRRAGAGERI